MDSSQVLQQLSRSVRPESHEKLDCISDYITTKKWYELGVVLQDLFNDDSMQGQKCFTFENLIKRYSELLDPFHLAHLLLSTSTEYNSFDEKIAFLEKESKMLEKKPEPLALISLSIANVLTLKGEFEQALKLLNEIEQKVTEATPLEVRSSFHKSQALLDKARADFDAFYQHALLFLSTSREYNNPDLALDLCMAALFSHGVCSFGELAAHHILDSLKEGKYQWLRELILLLDRGNPESIMEFNEKFLPIIKREPPFSDYVETIQTKLALSVFLQVIFSRPFENRTFDFDEVAQACNIPKDQVELLVLRALSAEIIKGNIDEVEQKIVVTWCKPKALGKERLMHLKNQIDNWIQIVHKQRVALEQRAQSIVG